VNRPISALGDERFTGRMTILLAATLVALAALLAAFVLAKSSEAQETNIITVGPLDVGFGAVEVGTTSDPVRTIFIRNTSGALLTINDVSILGTNASDFTLVDPIPAGGIVLDRDGEYGLDIEFTPSANGTRVAELTLQVLGGGTNLPTVNLSGTGVNQPPTSQPEAQGCDIVGTNNGETLTGTPNPDVICGLGGNDKINGLGANDVMKGGSGNDRITDKDGKDKLLGQSGKDRLNARDGQGGDLLKGGGSKDRAAKDKKDKARGI
jgi:Ca2+-binding RTX toxin-like protein